jgi:hypothetical protein
MPKQWIGEALTDWQHGMQGAKTMADKSESAQVKQPSELSDNSVNATRDKRIRDLPITVEKLL